MQSPGHDGRKLVSVRPRGGTTVEQRDLRDSIRCTPQLLDRMFRPEAIALVGVSGRAGSPMSRPLRYLREGGFRGRVYPVNPNYTELEGFPCYRTLSDVPGPVDLVLVMVPAAQAVEAILQAGEKGAAAAIVLASGFAETGADGAALQAKLIEAGRAAGVRVLGPNCQGLLYAPTKLAATFTAAADRPLPGGSGVAYVGQSGAVGGSILDLASEMGLELTAWVSTGNQADLGLVEVGAASLDDPAVRTLMLYLEAIGDAGARLAEDLVATAASLPKPMFVCWLAGRGRRSRPGDGAAGYGADRRRDQQPRWVPSGHHGRLRWRDHRRRRPDGGRVNAG
jgi:acyl-CoA synthetase (NDP forming)